MTRQALLGAELLTGVALQLADAPAGLSISEIAAEQGVAVNTARIAARVVARVDDTALPIRYYHAHDWEQRIRAYRGELEVRVVPVEGLCVGCTCNPDPSEFDTVEGRPVMVRCPRLSRVAVQARAPRHWIKRTAPMTEAERARLEARQVLRALSHDEAGTTLEEVAARALLTVARAAELLEAARAEGTVTTLQRVRPGRPAVTLYHRADVVGRGRC